MKLFQIDFSRTEKSPQIIEKEINDILDQGALKCASHCEGPSGRLHYSIYINEEKEPNSLCKLVRETDGEKTASKVNEVLESGAELLLPLQLIGAHSNNMFTTLFLKRKAEGTNEAGQNSRDPA